MRRAAALALVWSALATAAAAQAPGGGGRLEIDGGVAWASREGLGTQSADLPRNPTTGPGPFTLFTTRSELGAAAGVRASLGVWMTPRWGIEGEVEFSRPTLRAHVGGDAEGAPDVVATVPVSQYVVGASAVFQMSRSGRVVPYLEAGGGYLRQLEHDDQLLQTGRELHAGGGVRLWFHDSRRIGLRADGRASFPHGGISFGPGHRVTGSAGLSIACRF